MCLAGAGLGTSPARAAAPIPKFISPKSSPHTATEGKIPLIWQVEGNTDPVQFELQQARQEDFAEALTRYRGLDRATYVSGLPAGEFYYRVRIIGKDDQPGAWSDTMVVRVEYVSMRIVFWLMAAGVVVFAATVLTVLTGHRRAARAHAVEP